MQTNKILINIGVCIWCLLTAQTAWGQMAEATYTIRYNQTCGSDRRRLLGILNEKYTMGVAYFFDNINTTVAGVAGCWRNPSTSCCDVTYGSLTTLGTRNNTSNILTAQIDVWEDDCGSRCAFGTCTLNSDDCRWNGNVATTNYKSHAPSNGTYTNWVFANSTDHTIVYSYTWKYSGSSNLITPTCTARNRGLFGRICFVGGETVCR